jgi:hypothetical protein
MRKSQTKNSLKICLKKVFVNKIPFLYDCGGVNKSDQNELH